MTKKKTQKLDFGSKWNYAAAPESADHANIKKEYGLYINGKFGETDNFSKD